MIAGIADGHDRYNYGCQLALIFMSYRFYYRLVLASWADAVAALEGERMERGRSIVLARRGFVDINLAPQASVAV